MTIQSVLEAYPERSSVIVQELTNAGLHCASCKAAVWETLEEGMQGHGFSDKDIDRLVEKINTIIQEKIDPNTISMTKLAAEKFQEIVINEGKKGYCLRLGQKRGGCKGYEYTLDFAKEETPDDAIFTVREVKIIVNKEVLPKLLGSQIDYLEGLMGSGFKISNPNVTSSCHCGKSQKF